MLNLNELTSSRTWTLPYPSGVHKQLARSWLTTCPVLLFLPIIQLRVFLPIILLLVFLLIILLLAFLSIILLLHISTILKAKPVRNVDFICCVNNKRLRKIIYSLPFFVYTVQITCRNYKGIKIGITDFSHSEFQLTIPLN